MPFLVGAMEPTPSSPLSPLASPSPDPLTGAVRQQPTREQPFRQTKGKEVASSGAGGPSGPTPRPAVEDDIAALTAVVQRLSRRMDRLEAECRQNRRRNESGTLPTAAIDAEAVDAENVEIPSFQAGAEEIGPHSDESKSSTTATVATETNRRQNWTFAFLLVALVGFVMYAGNSSHDKVKVNMYTGQPGQQAVTPAAKIHQAHCALCGLPDVPWQSPNCNLYAVLGLWCGSEYAFRKLAEAKYQRLVDAKRVASPPEVLAAIYQTFYILADDARKAVYLKDVLPPGCGEVECLCAES